jgi:hypothetical protein
MSDYNFDLGSFEDIAAADLSNLDFGSNFDLGAFEDLVSSGALNDIDFGSNFDLGSFEDLIASDALSNIDLGSNFDLGSFEDIAAADLANIDLGSNFDLGSFEDIAAADLGNVASSSDFGSVADLGSFEDIAAVDRGNRGYYNEETGEFIYDENGPLAKPLDSSSGTNIESMDGYTYDAKSGTWTTPRGEVYTPKSPPSGRTQSGAQVMVNAGALPSGYAGLTPGKGSTASTTTSGTGTTTTKTGGGGGGGPTKTNTPQNGLGALLPLLLMLLAMNKSNKSESKGAVIPGLTATQRQTPYAQQQRAPGYRPGQGGISYFDQTQFTPKMAAGGGIARLLNGPGDGVSDSIPAMIEDEGMARGGQPAKLARGEYVIDARTVAALGNGSTDAGAERLDKMRKDILRDDRKAGVGKDSKAYRHLLA